VNLLAKLIPMLLTGSDWPEKSQASVPDKFKYGSRTGNDQLQPSYFVNAQLILLQTGKAEASD
jgi:hypothetical protein